MPFGKRKNRGWSRKKGKKKGSYVPRKKKKVEKADYSCLTLDSISKKEKLDKCDYGFLCAPKKKKVQQWADLMPKKGKKRPLEDIGILEKKKVKKIPWGDKVLASFPSIHVGKLGLAKIKKNITEQEGLDMTLKRNKNTLKRTLERLVKEETLVKIGASYAMRGYEMKGENLSLERKYVDWPLENPIWHRLRVLERDKAKSNHSICSCCGKKIEKGESRMKVHDTSLFHACLYPDSTDDCVGLGYIEGFGPKNEWIGKMTFFIHSACKDAAEEKFEKIFRKKWAELYPHINLEDYQ